MLTCIQVHACMPLIRCMQFIKWCTVGFQILGTKHPLKSSIAHILGYFIATVHFGIFCQLNKGSLHASANCLVACLSIAWPHRDGVWLIAVHTDLFLWSRKNDRACARVGGILHELGQAPNTSPRNQTHCAYMRWAKLVHI